MEWLSNWTWGQFQHPNAPTLHYSSPYILCVSAVYELFRIDICRYPEKLSSLIIGFFREVCGTGTRLLEELQKLGIRRAKWIHKLDNKICYLTRWT